MTALCKDSVYEHLCDLEQQTPSTLGISERAETINIDGIDIKQSSSLLHQSTGAMVWKSTIELAQVLETTSLGDLIKNNRVVELGCGTGALARLLSPLTAEYYATDQKPLLNLARANTEGTKVQVKELDWELHSWQGGPVDCIIACDTIYNEYLVPHLMDAINSVRGDRNIPTVLAIQVREVHMLANAFDLILSCFDVVHHCTRNGVAVYTLTARNEQQTIERLTPWS